MAYWSPPDLRRLRPDRLVARILLWEFLFLRLPLPLYFERSRLRMRREDGGRVRVAEQTNVCRRTAGGWPPQVLGIRHVIFRMDGIKNMLELGKCSLLDHAVGLINDWELHVGWVFEVGWVLVGHLFSKPSRSYIALDFFIPSRRHFFIARFRNVVYDPLPSIVNSDLPESRTAPTMVAALAGS